MSEYGYIQTVDNIKEQLKRLNRDYEGRLTWGRMYGSIDLSRQQAISKLTKDYSSAVGEAYAQALSQRQSIANSSLGSGYKASAYGDLDAALNEAFNTYKQNYLSNVNAVETSSLEAKNEVDAMLTSQAENILAYQDKPYEYLEYLYSLAQGSEDTLPDSTLQDLFMNDVQWNKYTTPLLNENGEDTDERRLLTKQELRQQHYDQQGNLTIKGADFYDQMLNQFASESGSKYSFNAWLAENDGELYSWSQSYNPYDYATDMYGNPTNIASFRTMFGMTSTDEQYKFIERFGGLSESEVNSMFKTYTNKATELQRLAVEGSTAEQLSTELISSIDDLDKLITDLGLQNDVQINFDELRRIIKQNSDNTMTSGEQWANSITSLVANIGSFATAGATGGSYIKAGEGTAIGAIGGAIIGFIVGAVKNAATAFNTGEVNKELAANSTQQYANLVTTLIGIAQNKRKNVQEK